MPAPMRNGGMVVRINCLDGTPCPEPQNFGCHSGFRLCQDPVNTLGTMGGLVCFRCKKVVTRLTLDDVLLPPVALCDECYADVP